MKCCAQSKQCASRCWNRTAERLGHAWATPCGSASRESFCLRQRDAQDIWLAALVEAMAQQLFGWHSTARLTHLACEVVVRGQAAVGLACGSTRNLSTDHVTEYTLALNRACRPPPCCLRWFDERLELATLPDGKGLAHRRLLLLWTSP